VEEGVKALKERERSDQTRYRQYYGVDPYDKSHFDFVIDSAGKTPEDVLQEIIEFLATTSKNL
jgi:cytidylate kinase